MTYTQRLTHQSHGDGYTYTINGDFLSVVRLA